MLARSASGVKVLESFDNLTENSLQSPSRLTPGTELQAYDDDPFASPDSFDVLAIYWFSVAFFECIL